MFPFEPNGKCQILLGLVDGKRLGPSNQGDQPTSGDIPLAFERIKSQFSALMPSIPGLFVRQLIVFDASNPLSQSEDVLFLSEQDGDDGSSRIMIKVSQLWTTGITNALEGFKDKPVSMVPAGSSQGFPRIARAPLHPQGDGSSTPLSAKSPSSLQGFSEAETQSDTSRGRFCIIQGMLYLQSGLWADALTSLSDGATLAFENHDHLWHGKALECLLVSMLLLSWGGVGYTVPQVCRSLPNRSGIFGADATTSSGGSLKTLAQLIPPLVETILELYAKVSNLDLGGSLQDLLRESRVRHVNLLVAIKGAGCVLNRQTLDQLILGHTQKLQSPIQSDGEYVSISKAGLANILIETLQTSQSSNNLSHYTSLLVAVASSLSTLKLDRKHAFYLKQLMQQFAPKLVEARKLGASEVGVHPAAGLPPLSNALQGVIPEMVIGTRTMLSLAASAYGVALPPVPALRERVPGELDDIQQKLAIWATEQSSGDILLKVEMLRVCVIVCEALPDIPASLHFTSNILRTARQTLMMPKLLSPTVPIIPSEEQVRLMDNMKRAVAAASRLGSHGYRAEYWDDFLVRDVQIFERDTFSKLIAHKPSDLSVRSHGQGDSIRDPFIYNPFSKDKSVTSAPVLVAGEVATFAVVLQNPLEIEVEIDEICLITNGPAFEASQHSIVLGPFSVQTFTLNGKPVEHGNLEVIGCRARIRNCYEQDFLTFQDDWKLPLTPKQKAIGGSKIRFRKANSSPEPGTDAANISFIPPATSSLRLKVINAQPRLHMKSSTLEPASIMLLEGECRPFKLTFANEAGSVAADLLLMTTEDSVTTQLQDALSKKDLTPAEIYEIQNQIATKPAISVKKEDSTQADVALEPAKDTIYTVEISGRAGLVSAAVQTDYTHLGLPSSEIKDTFYTRQIRFPIAITVNGSVEIPRCNILPIHGDFSWSSPQDSRSVSPHEGGELDSSLLRASDSSSMHTWLKAQTDGRDYCMLSLDLRNVWPQPLSINVQARKPPSDNFSDDDSWDDAYSVHETLQPGIVTRVVLLVPRIFLEDPYVAIPNLDTQKQFVVSASKLSVEAETTIRESFWYREKLLECLRGTWTEDSSGRHGQIDLRKGIRLSPRMVDALKLDHVDIQYSLTLFKNESDDKSATEDGVGVTQVGRSHFVLPSETFASLKVRVQNHTEDTLRLLLRLQPSLRHQPHNVALDLSKRFAWSGVLQRAIHPAIEPRGFCEAELGIIALVQGNYNINASVEEIKGRRKQPPTKTTDTVRMGPERRIWHARSPCLIDAVDP